MRVLPLLLAGLAACGPAMHADMPVSDAGAASDAGSAPDAGVAPDAGAAPDAGPASVPMKIASYSGGQGKYLAVSISVNGSAPFDVLLDTGSTGLRVIQSALNGTTVTTSTQPLSVDFGGNVMNGHKASATVTLGAQAKTAAIDFHLVESFACDAQTPDCDVKTAGASYWESQGIHGILGVGLRPDPDGLPSPLAALASRFTLDTVAGAIVLGVDEAAGGAKLQLKRLDTGWADDQLMLCFKVGGVATSPPCTQTVLDTGSNVDLLYATNVPAASMTSDGELAPNVSFEATEMTSGFEFGFTVGSPPTPSFDDVWVDATSGDAFSLLGIEVFLRHRVSFDLTAGTISLKKL
jgi:hypothetical protein